MTPPDVSAAAGRGGRWRHVTACRGTSGQKTAELELDDGRQKKPKNRANLPRTALV
jgi:hypothetical protein